jgi:hypothetical protein
LFPKKIPKLQLITKIEISKLNNITHKYKHTPKKNIQKKNFHGERIISKLKLPHSSFPRFLSNGQSVEYCETGNQTVLKNPNKTFQLLPYNIIAYSYTAVQNYIVRRISLLSIQGLEPFSEEQCFLLLKLKSCLRSTDPLIHSLCQGVSQK